MIEPLLAFGILAAALLAAVYVRLAVVERRLRALSQLNAKLDVLLKHSGIRFNRYEDVPHTVIEALERGKKIEAIKHYRAATGVGLQEAKEFVEELQRRATSRE